VMCVRMCHIVSVGMDAKYYRRRVCAVIMFVDILYQSKADGDFVIFACLLHICCPCVNGVRKRYCRGRVCTAC
jgi:hypothetical protein